MVMMTAVMVMMVMMVPWDEDRPMMMVMPEVMMVMPSVVMMVLDLNDNTFLL